VDVDGLPRSVDDVPEIHELSAGQQLAALSTGELTPTEVTQHYLSRIERLNGSVGALVEVTADAALARSRALEAARTAQPHDTRGALWGLPFADKDLVARAGVPTRYGSRAYVDHVPTTSDEFALIFDDADAISLGKTNTPEFGMTGYTETQIAPPARDPWDLALGAGGSSGGAAAAVALGLLPLAPASDGGGSIRIPAASVGLVGLKPSRGRLPVGSGLDDGGGLAVNGPIARTVADAALLLDAMIAARPYPYAVGAPGAGPFAAAVERAGRYRIGVSYVSTWDEWTSIQLDPIAREAVELSITALGSLGHEVDDIDWHPHGYPELFGTLWRGSAAGLRLDDTQLKLVEPITAWLVAEGRALDARRYGEAQVAARRFERETIAAFSAFDGVLTPALAQTPRPIGWFDAVDAERNFEQQVQYAPYSSFVNVAGLPAIVLPVHADASGHPVAVQLVGRPGGEAVLLDLAAQLERGQPLRHPPGWEAVSDS
jgi:amidase